MLEDREDLSLTCKVYLLVAELNDSFCEYTKELLKATSLQGEEVEVNKLFSSRWIRNNSACGKRVTDQKCDVTTWCHFHA